MAITVTGTATNNTFGGGLLQVQVLTNAALAGSPATASSTTAFNASITTTQAGSFVFGTLNNQTASTTFVASSGCTIISQASVNAGGAQGAAFKTSAGTGTPGATTVGSSTTFPGNYGVIAMEVLASGGTLTVDGSSPAVVSSTTATSFTTGSFTPPAGSVLVALLVASGNGTANVCAGTVSDTSGLTWTERIKISSTVGGTNSYSGIWTAVVPGGTAVAYTPALLPPGRQSPAAWAMLATQWPVTAAPPPAPPAGSQPHGYGSSRRSAASIWGGVAAPFLPGQPGTAPAHLVIARRTAARGLWRGWVSRTVNAGGTPAVSGTAPDHLVISRRAAARAVWRGTVSTTTNLQPGQVQDPSTRQPRRYPARAVWRGFISSTTNLQPGSVQPAATRQPRRTAARASWRGVVARTTNLQPGSAPDHLVIGRRYPARAVWAGTVSRTVNAAAAATGAGVTPDHLVVARRTAARASWAGTVTRTVNAAPAAGTTPDHLVIARRGAARAVWRGWVSTTVNAAPSAPVTGQVQELATRLLPRRYPSRAVWHGVTARTTNLPYGEQPGGLVSRRRPARATVYGRPPAGVPFQPPAGTAPRNLVIRHRRKARAYARWTPVTTTNAPPPAFQVARSTSAVTAADTSASSVTDPRDGTAAVTAAATSASSVS